jgi:hypothetical protein
MHFIVGFLKQNETIELKIMADALNEEIKELKQMNHELKMSSEDIRIGAEQKLKANNCENQQVIYFF